MPNLDHLSYSSVSSYLLCGRAWSFRYVEKVAAPTATALVMGSAFHDTVEGYITGKGDLVTLWGRVWGAQLERNPQIEWGADTPESLSNDGIRIISAKPVREMLDAIAANFDREHGEVERRVELHVPGVPIPVIGYIDIITKDGIPGDFKTAARMWANNKASEELQPLVYLAALNQQGIDTHQWRFNHYVATKTARPDARVFSTQRSPDEVFRNLFPTIQQVWSGIQANVFPKNTSTWKCSPKYCEYYGMCQGG